MISQYQNATLMKLLFLVFLSELVGGDSSQLSSCALKGFASEREAEAHGAPACTLASRYVGTFQELCMSNKGMDTHVQTHTLASDRK